LTGTAHVRYTDREGGWHSFYIRLDQDETLEDALASGEIQAILDEQEARMDTNVPSGPKHIESIEEREPFRPRRIYPTNRRLRRVTQPKNETPKE